jgi:outer membrane protein W
MKSQIIGLLMLGIFNTLPAQELPHKKRLDFAQTYFEYGGLYSPSFIGKHLQDNEINLFENSATISQYLTWGGFHFHGHAEFYVTFPLSQLKLNNSQNTDFELTPTVVTGARYLPWAFQKEKIIPYFGLSWSTLSFKQNSGNNEDSPTFSKDFMLVPDAGVLYGYRSFALRLGVHYLTNREWNYALSKTTFSQIKSPKFRIQLGLNYSFENSKSKQHEVNDRWNSFPRQSKLGYAALRAADFFIGVGPSGSFSLARSGYTQKQLPYLQDKIVSSGYLDIAIGYQSNSRGWFTALSFRNPIFETKGFGDSQTIKKTSMAIEVNKFIVDYSGFVPYIGLNLAYDHISYTERVDENVKTLEYKQIEPGLTIGWDIAPGKTDEAFILRTNLRWYPLSSFEVEGIKFRFSQLEYNLIQAVFYPGRFSWKQVKF